MKEREIFIGEYLRELREASNHSQEEMAHLCGVDTRSIYNLEIDKHLPILDTFGKLAVALNMKPSDLLRGIEENTNYLSMMTKYVESRRK